MVLWGDVIRRQTEWTLPRVRFWLPSLLTLLFLPHRSISSFLQYSAPCSMHPPVVFLTPRIPFPPAEIQLGGPLSWGAQHPRAAPAPCLSRHLLHLVTASLRDPGLPSESSAELWKVHISAGEPEQQVCSRRELPPTSRGKRTWPVFMCGPQRYLVSIC